MLGDENGVVRAWWWTLEHPPDDAVAPAGFLLAAISLLLGVYNLYRSRPRVAVTHMTSGRLQVWPNGTQYLKLDDSLLHVLNVGGQDVTITEVGIEASGGEAHTPLNPIPGPQPPPPL